MWGCFFWGVGGSEGEGGLRSQNAPMIHHDYMIEHCIRDHVYIYIYIYEQ